jgi:peroxiredoxin
MTQNMNKSFLILVFIFCANISFSQKPKDILLKSKEACEKVKSASFDAELYFKFFDNKDTVHLTGRMNLLKLDTNESGVIGRKLSDDGPAYFQFADKTIGVTKNKIVVDTIYYKRAFNGNTGTDLFNISFMKIHSYKVLDEKTNKYEMLAHTKSTFTIGIQINEDDELDKCYSTFTIDKKSWLPIAFTNVVRYKPQNQYQYRSLKITNLSINDDSANYYLNHLDIRKYDTVKYVEKYVRPKLLDSNTFAPDWKFPVYGKNDSISLSQFRGKYVLMDYWYVSCYPCQKAIPSLLKLQEKFKDKLVVLGMNPFDNDEKLNEFIPKNKINYQVIKCKSDFPRSKYNVVAYPTMYILNKEGKIIKTEIGFSPEENYAEKFEREISELIKD